MIQTNADLIFQKLGFYQAKKLIFVLKIVIWNLENLYIDAIPPGGRGGGALSSIASVVA